MNNDLTGQAINAALTGDYNKAIEINKKILKIKKNNVQALSRIASAYLELGDLEKAKKFYKKGFTLDPYNTIVIKNLKKIEKIKPLKNKINNYSPLIVNQLFVSEPGKTKITLLMNLPPVENYLSVKPGTSVCLTCKKRGILVYLSGNGNDKKNGYLGSLPDDLASKINRLTQKGNRYQAYIKNVSLTSVSIIIQEIYRCKKCQDQPSF